MPKRDRDRHSDGDYSHIAKKLRKLQREMKHARRHHRRKLPSSSESDIQSPHNSPEGKSVANTDDNYEVYSPGCSSWIDVSESANETPRGKGTRDAIADQPLSVTRRLTPRATLTSPPHTPNPKEPDFDVRMSTTEAGTSVVPPLQLPPDEIVDAAANNSNSPGPPEQELDPDIMNILGEDPTYNKTYGPNIQKDLAVRLGHITTTGLSKENRKEIKEKYLIPDNCRLLNAPALNPEIRAALIESQVKRDKGIENKQKMTACALSSLSSAITMLLTSDNKNPELLKLLMDTARTLGDIQHSDSILRRFFVLSTVKKDLKEELQKTKIDEMLFGSNLAETLKSARTINKSGLDIRYTATAKTPVQLTKTSGRPLNYRPPPAARRPAAAGAARGARLPPPPPPPPPPAQTPRPTTTGPTQHNAYRTSSRQPPMRHRR